MTRVALVVAMVVAGVAVAVGQSFPTRVWTAIATTGTVDEGDTGIYEFHDTGAVAFKSSAVSGTLDVRFNVTGLPVVETAPPPEEPDGPLGHCVALRAVVRDTGAGARVVVRLMQLDLFRGTGIRTLGELDSDAALLASTSYHRLERCLSLPVDFQFDSGQFVYFVQAQLVKSSGAANPGLRAVSVCNRTAACDDN